MNPFTSNTNPDTSFRLIFVSGLAIIVGLAAGFIAYGLLLLIGLISNIIFNQTIATNLPHLQYHYLGWFILFIPALGGIIIGLMAKYGTSKIKGHGIPEAMEAVLTEKSNISPKVAILKPLSAAIAIGTGGPYGAEGPIIQTGGAFGSIIGQLFKTTASERKVLLACGAAAGMAATFNTPIAGVIIAIELLLFEFKSRSFIPLVVASTIATTVHYFLIGKGPLFTVEPTNFDIIHGFPFYILLGLICGLAAIGFKEAFYWVEDQFEKLPFDEMWYPAIGGLGLGIIGFFFPRVLGVGYDTITAILNNHLALSVLLGVMVFKALALMISLGSGTSGGLLAPMFMSGAAMGGAYALILDHFFPALHLAPGAFALVAMAAVFGASSRATFTLIIFAFEITRNYEAILPLMIVCVLANAIAYLWMSNTIMTEKLERRGLSVNQDYEVDILYRVKVREVMDTEQIAIPAAMTLHELEHKISTREPDYIRHQGLPIADEEGKLVGIITRGDLLKGIEEHPKGEITVLEAGTNAPVVAYENQSLHEISLLMVKHKVGRLPVVSRQNPTKLTGYLGRAAILEARSRYLHEEQKRERSWFKGSASIVG